MTHTKPNLRALPAFLFDIFAVVMAWTGAYWLRFNLYVPAEVFVSIEMTLGVAVPIQVVSCWLWGLYRGIWRYASLRDLQRILAAVATGVAGIGSILFLWRDPAIEIPRSVLVIYPLLLVLIMGGSRVAYRLAKEYVRYGGLYSMGKPVIVLGAGDAAVGLIKELERLQEWRVVALLDDDRSKVGRQIHGISVIGSLADLPDKAERLGVKQAIVAMPSASHSARHRAADLCRKAGLEVYTVPSFDELMSGKVQISQIRHVELDDLLGRDPVLLDNTGLHGLLTGRVAMVTGAGGSIGSELCRQIARFEPSLLVLFELNEFALYRMEQEFSRTFPHLQIVCSIGDVKDDARLDQVMRQYPPTAVFHAAAYKHVPLMEQENAWQAMRNNVLGTYIVARVAMRHGVEKFVLISTDKAVNPTNVMGASKRLAEMVCQGLQGPFSSNGSASTGHPTPSPTLPLQGGGGSDSRGEGGASGTRFVMVRFGNVLGSTGSVIPKFQEQIARGGPITVTHPEITRYFMSIPEAAQLVLQAGLMGGGGEIFVLDMGEPVRIVDLAKDMIRLSGFSEGDIPIVFTGLRPGEKLYEELLADDEHTLPTPHPKLRIAQACMADSVWLDALLQWAGSGEMLSEQEVKQGLKRWVPEYVAHEVN